MANRLIFVLPSKSLEIKLNTDKTSYSPGDIVNYEVTVIDKATSSPVKDDVLIAVGVTDLSSFLEVENKKQPPSLVSKVYLEKEIKVTKEYEFLNANEFIDFIYQPDLKKDESIRKLELLLGTQKWRLFMFDPHFKNYHRSDQYGEDKLKAYLLQNLLMTANPPAYAMNGMVMEAMPMMAGAPMAREGILKKTAAVPKPAPPAQKPSPIAKDKESETEIKNTENSSKSSKEEFAAERVNFKQTQLFTTFFNAKNGKYKGSFKLTDVITKFRFSVDAVSTSGVYGALVDSFNSNKDFYIESNIPFFLTSQDKINVPVIIHNNKNEDLNVDLSVSTTLENDELEAVFAESSVKVDKKSSKSVILKLKAKKQTKDEFKVKVEAKWSTCSDSFVKSSKIIGRGFPVSKTQSGFIGTNGNEFKNEASLEVSLPSTFEEGTLEVKAKIYTSQLSHIYEALERLIRDPYGCFEQTSSTTYPLVMALILMKNLPEKSEKITQMMIEGKQKLQKGYERLLTFETSTGGYEWFGSSPGHEALTAYGLMQFNEMKEVLANVDQTMIDRVTKWILEKRDGNGSFKMSQHGLDSFGSPPPSLSDAYILWVLTSVGQNTGLEKEIKSVIEKAKASGDSYLNALVANILYNVGRTDEAREISRILKNHQDKKTGEVERKETSITRSSGSSLNIETTALSILAWMKDTSSEFSSSVELGVNYIVSNIKDGKYGSTQGTILSLKVLVEFLKNSKLNGKGTFELTIDGESVKSYDFDNNTDTSTLGN